MCSLSLVARSLWLVARLYRSARAGEESGCALADVGVVALLVVHVAAAMLPVVRLARAFEVGAGQGRSCASCSQPGARWRRRLLMALPMALTCTSHPHRHCRNLSCPPARAVGSGMQWPILRHTRVGPITSGRGVGSCRPPPGWRLPMSGGPFRLERPASLRVGFAALTLRARAFPPAAREAALRGAACLEPASGEPSTSGAPSMSGGPWLARVHMGLDWTAALRVAGGTCSRARARRALRSLAAAALSIGCTRVAAIYTRSFLKLLRYQTG